MFGFQNPAVVHPTGFHHHPNKVSALNQTSAGFKFSTAVAWFGLKLRDSQLVTDKSSAAIAQLAREGLAYDQDGYKAEFIRLVEAVQ
jgi:Ca-activated chloride channel family protein